MQTILAQAADILLICASLGAAIYCMVLSRRLTRLGSFDKGIGGAIAVLSAQVEEMKTALGAAKAGTDGAERQLEDLVGQAREISAELEMMIAACHDFAETAIDAQTAAGSTVEFRRDPTRLSAVGGTKDTGRIDGDAAGTDAAGGSVPVFGSRRGTTSAQAPIPMFRHRAAAKG
jgi:hypothetical protein